MEKMHVHSFRAPDQSHDRLVTAPRMPEMLVVAHDPPSHVWLPVAFGVLPRVAAVDHFFHWLL